MSKKKIEAATKSAANPSAGAEVLPPALPASVPSEVKSAEVAAENSKTDGIPEGSENTVQNEGTSEVDTAPASEPEPNRFDLAVDVNGNTKIQMGAGQKNQIAAESRYFY